MSIFRSLVVRLAATAILFAGFAAAAWSADVQSSGPAFWHWGERPTMGWNSWDCYGAGVNEEQTLANAQYMKEKLLSHGYNLITVDIQWYEPQAHGTGYRRNAALEMDTNGRLLPAANRFPLAKETRSFKPLADKLHEMGLRFGIHLLRGIPRRQSIRTCRFLALRISTTVLSTRLISRIKPIFAIGTPTCTAST